MTQWLRALAGLAGDLNSVPGGVHARQLTPPVILSLPPPSDALGSSGSCSHTHMQAYTPP